MSTLLAGTCNTLRQSAGLGVDSSWRAERLDQAVVTASLPACLSVHSVDASGKKSDGLFATNSLFRQSVANICRKNLIVWMALKRYLFPIWRNK